MTPRKGDVRNPNKVGILLGILPVFILILSSIQSGLASEPIIIDNLDHSFTVTWDFNDMTNYTLDNLTAANGEVNLTYGDYFWNQSNAQDFNQGQGNNVVSGEGIFTSIDDLVIGYLNNQNFTTNNHWNFTNGTDSNVISQLSPSERGWLISSYLKNTTVQNVTLQPDSMNGIDTFLNGSDQLMNYGNNESLIVGNSANEQRIVIWFDVSSFSESKVLDVQLELYFYYADEITSTDISVHRITYPWAEMIASWQERDATNLWISAGGDYDATAIDTISGITNNYGWKSWNITSLVEAWTDGTYDNYGVLIRIPSGSPGVKQFYSSDYSIAALRPKLNISHYPLNTFNETAYISQEFALTDQYSYGDSIVSEFDLGDRKNITISSTNEGEIGLYAGGYTVFDALENVTNWQEDPDTTKNSGGFDLNTMIFYEGSGSMELIYDLASTQQSYGVMRTTATYWDWSIFSALELWVKSYSQGEAMTVIIEDSYGTSWESSPVSPTDFWEKYSFDLADFTGDISSIDTLRIRFSDTTLPTISYLDNITLTGGAPYVPEGTFTSRVFDGDYIIQWEKIYWAEQKPSGTDTEIQTRTGNTSVPDASWSDWSLPCSDPNGSIITSPEGRYIQYKAYLNTTDTDLSPTISEVILVKLEHNLTFKYQVDSFENVTRAGLSVKLGGEVLWEEDISSVTSETTIYLDIGRYLKNSGILSIEFGLTVNANSTEDVNISAMMDDFQIKGPKGTYLSGVFDAGTEVVWNNATWNADIPLNTNISVKTRSSLDNVTWSSWSSYLGQIMDNITSPPGRYFQYQLDFFTQILGLTPVFKDINFTYTKYYDMGILTFEKDLIDINVTNWGMFSYNHSLNGQSITYEYSINSGISWYTIPGDGNLSFVSVSTKKIRFKAIFTAENTSLTPNLFSVELTYLVNRPPAIVGVVPNQTQSEDGGPWSLDLTFYESDFEDTPEKLKWHITGENTSLYNIDGEYSADDVITFTPLPEAFGDDQVTLWLEDSFGAKTSQTLWINITPVNDAPSIVGIIPSFEKIEDALNWNYDLSAYKYDVDNLSSELFWQVVGWDALLFDSVSIIGDTIFFDLALDANGNDEMTIILSDGLLTDTQNFWVNITPQNDAPLISGVIPDYNVNEDDLPWILDLTLNETDIDDPFPSANLSWSVLGVDSNLLSVSILDNNITFTLKPDAYGNDEITIILTDGGGLTDSQNIWINVTPDNDAPNIVGVIPNFEKIEDALNWNYDLSTYKYDVDNLSSELSWQVIGWDALLFDSVSIIGDTIFFDLALDAYGNDEITIILSDGLLTDTQSIWVNVTPLNDAPIINGVIPNYNMNEDDLPWTLDLTSYESDVEDTFPSSNLSWSVTGIDTNLLSITITDNNITFTLKPDAYGDNEIMIILIDSGGLTESQNIWVNVTPDNDAPNIVGIIPNFEKNEDALNWNHNLTPYKYDVDNLSSELTWQVVGVDPLLFDSVSIVGDTIFFDLAFNAYGNDQMTIILSDGLLTDSQNFWVNVTSLNDAPVINGIIPDYDMNEDDLPWILDLTSYESDVEDVYPSASLSWSVTDVDSDLLSISISDNNITFTLKPDAYGDNEITIILTDSGSLTDSQKIWINVTPDNDAPNIVGIIPNFEKNEDALNWNYVLSAYKYDVDNLSSELTWQIVGWDASLFDSVTVIGDTIFFDLALNAYGNDQMTIILSDGLLTDFQNFWVNVTPINDAPVITGILPDYSRNEDDLPWVLDLTSFETDVEDTYPSASLTWSLSGVDSDLLLVSILDNNITFTLKPDAYGNNEITIILTDSGGLTDSRNIWINVTPQNDPPNILGIIPNFDKNEDAVGWNYDLSSFKSDIDNLTSELTWQIVGVDPLLFDFVSIVGDTIFFDLALNAYGNNQMTVILSDGLLTDSQSFWVNITPINDAPLISGIIPDYDMNEDDLPWILDLTSYESDVEDVYPSASLSWSITDVDSDLLSISISDNNITFTLKQDAYGDNEITIILTDSGDLTDSLKIWVNVTAQNDAPDINGVIPNFQKEEDAANWNFDLSSYKFDVDNNTSDLSWSILGWDTSLFDSVNIAGDTLAFDLAQHAYGNDIMMIRLSDGVLFDAQNVWVNITPINDAPVIIGSIPDIQRLEDSTSWTFDLTSYESDLEDGSPSSSLIWNVTDVNTSLISITIVDNNLTITPQPNAYGINYITVILRDSGGKNDFQGVKIEIIPQNDAPSIQPTVPNIVLDEDTSITFNLLGYGSDLEDSPSQLRWSITGANRSLYNWQIEPGTNRLYIDSLTNAYGTDDVTLVLMDGDGGTAIQPLQIVIIPVNDAPYIYPQVPQSYFETMESQTIVVTLTGFENDVDDPNDFLNWHVEGADDTIITVSVNLQSDELIIIPMIEFSPDDTNSVEDEITLVLSDSDGMTDQHNVTVVIYPVNNAPIIKPLPDLMVKYDVPYMFNLSPYISDADTDKDQLIVTTSQPYQDLGNGYIKPEGMILTIEYPISKSGDSFSVVVTVSDGQLSSYGIIYITVSDNTPPQLIKMLPDVEFDEDSSAPAAFNLGDYFLDLEEGGLNFSFYLNYIYHGDDYIFVSINNDNSVDFSAALDWFGKEEITFRAEDLEGAILEDTIVVTVNPVNDPPEISGVPDQVCKIDFEKVLDLTPYVTDVDTSWDSLTVYTDSDYITVQGFDLIFYYNDTTQEMVTITVTDGFYQDSITILVTASTNKPPSFDIIPELVVKGGEVYLFSFTPYVIDEDNSWEDLEVWTDSNYINTSQANKMLLKIDYPVEFIGQQFDVVVFVTDGQDINSTTISIYVTDELIPTLLKPLPDLAFDEDTLYDNALNLSHYFKDALVYDFFGSENVDINIQNGLISLSAAENWSGVEQITIRGLLGKAFVEDTINVIVRPINDPPVLSPLPYFDKKVNDVWILNLEDYIYDVDTQLSDMEISVDSPYVIPFSMKLYFQYQFETYDIVVLTVSDGKNVISGLLFVNVTRDNNAPVYVGLLSTESIKSGVPWSIDLDDYFYDMDGDQLTFSCNKPEITINPITHEATWTPTKGSDSLTNVIFTASDGSLSVDSYPIDLLIESEKPKASFWELYWWVIPLIALLLAFLIIFFLLMRAGEGEEEEKFELDVDKAVDYLSVHGGNYIIKSEDSDNTYGVFSGLLKSGFEGLCITTKQTENLKNYDLGKAWIIKLDLKRGKGEDGKGEGATMIGMLALGDDQRGDDQYTFASNFSRMVDTVEEFLVAGNRKVVLFDGLEFILVGDEMIMYIGFLASLREKLKEKNSCLLIPIDPKTLSEKELNLLERESKSLEKALAEAPEEKSKEEPKEEMKEEEESTDYYSELYDLVSKSETEEDTEDIEDDEMDFQDYQNHEDIDDTDY